eukprot:10440075-Alexandrium_andersonii.AAC.1
MVKVLKDSDAALFDANKLDEPLDRADNLTRQIKLDTVKTMCALLRAWQGDESTKEEELPLPVPPVPPPAGAVASAPAEQGTVAAP